MMYTQENGYAYTVFTTYRETLLYSYHSAVTVTRYRISVTGNRRVCMVPPEYRIMGVRGILCCVTLFDGNTENTHGKTVMFTRSKRLTAYYNYVVLRYTVPSLNGYSYRVNDTGNTCVYAFRVYSREKRGPQTAAHRIIIFISLLMVLKL